MIHIVTHPLIGNYGGMLQAFALQRAVAGLGHSVKVCDEVPEFAKSGYFSRGRRVRWNQCKEIINIISGRLTYTPAFLKYKVAKSFKIAFMEVSNKSEIAAGDSFIIGSDQVWRLEYTRTYSGAEHFFLDFATPEQRQRSIAYAASYGTDKWEGTPEETETCRALLQDFKAVSVREESGIGLCRKIFGVKALQMPDPTLLLNAGEYSNLINKSRTRRPCSRYMADYVLDSAPEIQQLLEATARQQNMYRQHLMPHVHAEKCRDRFPMSVPQWLRCIRDSQYMITDSFHGCVFSIIFNRPFICLGNAARGSSRFDTLLKTFGLQGRMLTEPTPQAVEELISTPIDWAGVNARIEDERRRGLQFLQQYLPQA